MTHASVSAGSEDGVGCVVAADQTEWRWHGLYSMRGVAAKQSPDSAYNQYVADCDGYCKYCAQGFE